MSPSLSDLALVSTTDIVDEFKRRNMSFVIAWCDHQQFDLHTDGIVWGVEHGGALPLKLALLTLLQEQMDSVTEDKVKPGIQDA